MARPGSASSSSSYGPTGQERPQSDSGNGRNKAEQLETHVDQRAPAVTDLAVEDPKDVGLVRVRRRLIDDNAALARPEVAVEFDLSA
jgi:hypothetical protein